MAEGRVEQFNESKKGYGFVEKDGGTGLFGRLPVIAGNGSRSPIEADRVSFVEGNGARGPRAIQVRML